MPTRSLFLFRRDLRLEDNLGLLAALKESESVVPAFIFDPMQVDKPRHEYFSEAAFVFLLNSLRELDDALRERKSKLYIFYGAPEEVVESLIKQDQITSVYCNRDYTPFARQRDETIAATCATQQVPLLEFSDLTLSPIETIRTGQDSPYTVFTPFMRKASQHTVPKPIANYYHNYYTGTLNTKTTNWSKFTAEISERELVLQGGRNEALKILTHSKTWLSDYATRRNLTSDANGTSRLSAHHKFGTISIRETFHAVKKTRADVTTYISELYWRDFYYYIALHFPSVFGRAFLPWADNIKWLNDPDQFAAWCAGKTGVPLVDAGIRQLNHTGYMHNRARMVVASYLTKNLLIDWRWGERYFASQLIDYDPASNNGGWQWSASVGADPKPIRIFNPHTQAAKYDPEAKYIHKWVPGLRSVSSEILTDGKTQTYGLLAPDYPAPLVDQKESYHRARAAYQAAKQNTRQHKNFSSQ